jgi:hypothetical protein
MVAQETIELVNQIESAELEENKTTYLSSIDADVDEGMVDLINYFNHDFGHPTKYCCSGLLRDHYDMGKLQQLDFSQASPIVYNYVVEPPYFVLQPIYHTWDGEKTLIQREFHTFRDNLPGGVAVSVIEDNVENIIAHNLVDFRFTHEFVDKADRVQSETNTYNYSFYLGSRNSLKSLFAGMRGNIKLYDAMLDEILEMFQIMHKYPRSIFKFTHLEVARDTEELVWNINRVSEIPENVTGVEVNRIEQSEEWKITGTLDQITNDICNNTSYIEKMPQNHQLD